MPLLLYLSVESKVQSSVQSIRIWDTWLYIMISISDDFKSKWLLNIWCEKPIAISLKVYHNGFTIHQKVICQPSPADFGYYYWNKYYLGSVIEICEVYLFMISVTVTFGNLAGSHIAQCVIELAWILGVLISHNHYDWS